ncbi:hypothetical protein OG324_00275 [Streptomyces sp. NBC_01236]|nr:hypothetical protein OG324_00275 [Streptomyces sp. NBC_01236]
MIGLLNPAFGSTGEVTETRRWWEPLDRCDEPWWTR